MFTKTTLVVPLVLVLAGCAAYEPPALTAEHPAHPEAMALQDSPRSMTLSYGSSETMASRPVQMAQQDMQDAQTGMESTMGGMQHGSMPAKPHGQLFKGEGKVVAVVPGSQVVLDHEPIPGFMDAMTMGYKVDPPSILQGLEAGDSVRFTIDAGKKAVVGIEKLE